MKKFVWLSIFVFFLADITVGVCDAASYYIPPSASNAGTQTITLGFGDIAAHFADATGSFNYDRDSKSISHLRLAINAGSLTLDNAENQRDLYALLDIARYPEIRLIAPDAVTLKDGKADIPLNMTLHGVTKPVTLEASLNSAGGTSLILRGTVKRADFNIGAIPDADGKNRIGDSIAVQFEMQAIKQ